MVVSGNRLPAARLPPPLSPPTRGGEAPSSRVASVKPGQCGLPRSLPKPALPPEGSGFRPKGRSTHPPFSPPHDPDMVTTLGPRGGMVDAGDLKSLAARRAGSSPAAGTRGHPCLVSKDAIRGRTANSAVTSLYDRGLLVVLTRNRERTKAVVFGPNLAPIPSSSIRYPPETFRLGFLRLVHLILHLDMGRSSSLH